MKLTDEMIERSYLRLDNKDRENIDRNASRLTKTIPNMGRRSALELLAVIGAFMQTHMKGD